MLDRKRVGWFILFRVATVSLILVSSVFLDLQDSVVSLPGLVRLTVATYLFSALSLVVLRVADRASRTVAYAQIVWDVILITLLILLTGGVSSPYAFLFFLCIISASVLLARSQAYYTASLCVILHGAILDLQFYGRLAPLGLSSVPAQQYGATYLFYLIFLYSLAFYLTAFLAGHLSERARLSESALKEKVIDFEELERLNSSIVSTIESGLITINPQARIRVFNRYAETVTGLSQLEAYDRPLGEVLPGLDPRLSDLFAVSQGELEHISPSGGRLVLSYKSVPLLTKGGEPDGAVLELRDLTEMKRLAQELKRADRLAAVGELSARIAHEIRNPLAAISGSVQLVALRDWADEKDRKLFSIILRETDRLDGLLREFLAYARPNAPNKAPFELRQLMTDLCALLMKDPRLEGVKIENSVPETVTVVADRDQCKQVFWNLFVNGAEAMPQGGTIEVQAQFRHEQVGEVVRITVTDDGVGMDAAEVKRVFEPFFTTKKIGTGLGLATVYRIVEAHQGRILVESAAGAGTTVTIDLPA